VPSESRVKPPATDGKLPDIVDGVHYLEVLMETSVDRVRDFNRGWTEVLGLLDQGLLKTDHSLAEARVLFELAQRQSWERQELRERLGMDASFLTRVLGRLESQDLVESKPSDVDGRALVVELTGAGRRAFEILDRRSAEQVGELLAPLTSEQRTTVTESMTVISRLVRPSPVESDISLRDLEPGDMGWVIGRHGAIYWDEFGWDSDFEALVAGIVANYHSNLRPGRERAWIAEVDGARAGCVFCCERDIDTAQLRILLVEPWARGLGLGTRLVDECVTFARDAGYAKMMLWTNSVLVAARHIYEAVGFKLVEEEQHHSFGHDLIGQNWELEFRAKE
jgi:DNA-binding MarR family transcriptional regulator/GNAT superfamily N-acetyltransferase